MRYYVILNNKVLDGVQKALFNRFTTLSRSVDYQNVGRVIMVVNKSNEKNLLKGITKRIIALFLVVSVMLTICNYTAPVYTCADEVIERDGYYIDILEYNGHKYEIVKPIIKKEVTWYTAEQICEKWNGHLATVTSNDEQEVLQNYIAEKYGEDAMKNYWIGGYRDTEIDEWKWITGEKWNYTNWASNEPNNYSGYIESYAHLIGKYYSSSKTVGKWNDASDNGAGYANSFFNSDEYGFICEYDNFDASGSYKTGRVKFPSYIESEEDISSTYYYRDDYFMKDSSEFNASLATMSLCLELASWNSNYPKENIDDPTGRTRNVRDLLQDQLNFKKVDTESYIMKDKYGNTVTSREDSIAYTLGYKNFLEGGLYTTVVAVAIRGGGYGREWASNFDIGYSGQHTGFSHAAKMVSNGLKEYIEENGSEFSKNRVVFWITGYSRAGATANLLAGNLLNGTYDIGCGISTKNVYAYCFEPAKGAIKSEIDTSSNIYDCIFNIVNPNDLVTYVAPASKGFEFTRFGKTFALPTNQNTSGYGYYKNRMTTNLMNMIGKYGYNQYDIEKSIYSVDDFEVYTPWTVAGSAIINKITPDFIKVKNTKKYPMDVFIDDIVDIIGTEVFESRYNYSKKFQDIIKAIVGVSMSGAAKEDFTEAMKSITVNVSHKIMTKYQDDIYLAAVCGNNTKMQLIVTKAFFEVLDELNIKVNDALDHAGISYKGNFALDTTGLIEEVVEKLALRHPFLTADLVKNAGMIFQPHYPENTLAWMQSFDTNYMSNVSEWKLTNSYKKISINCPVDVAVYDSQGKQVSYIKNDEVQNIENGLTSYVDYDGQKIVCIPKDATYNIEILATDNGKVNCSIADYNCVEGENKRVDNFYEMSVKKGDKLTISIGESSENGEESYVIKNGNENINPDVSVSGDEAAKKYSIGVSAQGKGRVSGESRKNLGEFAEVKAVADEGYSLVGWYEDNKLLSKEQAYRFVVKTDRNLVAKFEKKKDNVVVNISKKQYTYSGKLIKPRVSVLKNGICVDRKLYDIKYSNNRNVGRATITVLFKGELSNVVAEKIGFAIVPKGTKITRLVAKKKGLSVYWKKNKKQITGYVIKYSTNKKMKKRVKTKVIKNPKTGLITINKLLSKRRYYVKIATYKLIKGKKYYSNYSKVKRVKTK